MIRWGRAVRILALPLGLLLLAIAIVHADVASLRRAMLQLGPTLPLVLLPGAAWHLLRTVAWRWSFPRTAQPPFWRLFRVRLAAEAVSFVTVRGVAGEPLKVLLLPDVDAAASTAAVALERLAYLAVTGAIVCAASIVALIVLPLSRVWFDVFAVTALVSGLITALLAILPLRGASTSDASHAEAPAHRPRTVRAFTAAAARQLRELVHGDRRRLLLIVVLEAAAYLTMALEVWAALRAAGVSPSLVGSIAIETVTRVASMASAFIPGNLGALEASNVVAAGIIDAAAGAAALAVVRRLRGLLWCAVGFACYPAGAGARIVGTGQDTPGTLAVEEDRSASVSIAAPLGGLPIGERIARAAARAGYRRLLVLTSKEPDAWRAIAARIARSIEVIVVADEHAWRARVAAEGAGVVPSSRVFSPEQLRTMAGRSQSIAAAGPPPGEALKVGHPGELRLAEVRLRASIVKPTDGRAGRFNRRLSIPVSVALIRLTRCSANALSVTLIVLGLYSGWLLSRGSYGIGILGALVSLAASILDGCDGELARLQYTDSAFGVWLDTLGDYVYYLAVFAGLTVGAVRQTQWDGFWWIGGALMAGCVATFALLILLRRRITNGHPERLRTEAQTHFERRGSRWTAVVAKLSTFATRATMPYGILIFALLHALPALLVLAALGAQIYWISLARELGRLLSPAPPPDLERMAHGG